MPKNFDDITQEKFDAMNEGMKKSLWTCKELKIKSIDIQDYKNIEYINTELWDINIIWWENWNWKSSFVESIFVAIQGNVVFWKWKIQPAQLIKKWENKAVIKMIVSWKETEIIIERQFTKGTKSKPQGNTKLIATKNWEEIKQNDLNEILKSVTIDPIAFWELSINEQIQQIKLSTGLNTSDIDKEISDKEEDRKESNRYKKERATIYDDLTASWIPKEVKEVSLSWLIEDRKIVENKDNKLVEYKNKKQQIEDIEEKLLLMKNELVTIKAEWSKLHKEAKPLWSIEDIDNKISDIEWENKKAEKYKKYIEAKKDNKEAIEDAEKDNELLQELKEKRIKIISDSNLPKYMTISEDLWILVDWIEFKLLNTARKIEVTIDLILISNSPLRTIRIENWWELDIKTLKEISDKIEKAWFQWFFERPIIDKYDSIIINWWELLEWEEKKDFINNQ